MIKTNPSLLFNSVLSGRTCSRENEYKLCWAWTRAQTVRRTCPTKEQIVLRVCRFTMQNRVNVIHMFRCSRFTDRYLTYISVPVLPPPHPQFDAAHTSYILLDVWQHSRHFPCIQKYKVTRTKRDTFRVLLRRSTVTRGKLPGTTTSTGYSAGRVTDRANRTTQVN